MPYGHVRLGVNITSELVCRLIIFLWINCPGTVESTGPVVPFAGSDCFVSATSGSHVDVVNLG